MTELAKKLGVFINEFFCLTAKKQVSIMLLEESRPYQNGSCASPPRLFGLHFPFLWCSVSSVVN